MKLVRLIEMCLNETFSRVRVEKHLSGMFSIKNGWKQGNALSCFFCQLCCRLCHQEGLGKTGCLEIKRYTSAFRLC